MKILVAASLAFCFVSASSHALAQGGVRRFCTPGAGGSRISAAGSASFTANGGSGDLVLHASNVPAGSVARFVYGNASLSPTPFGNGFRCVGGALFRLPAQVAGPTGDLAHALDYLAPPSPAGAIAVGSTWSFQCWFHSGAVLDSSDALQIVFGAPQSLTSTTLLTGVRSAHPLGQAAGGVVVITSAARWTDFWSVHTSGSTPPPPVPPVDFTQNAVVAAFAGWRGTGGFSVGVEQLRLSVATLHVRTLEHRPGPGCGVSFGETQPFQFVLVPRVEHLTLGHWDPVAVANPPCP